MNVLVIYEYRKQSANYNIAVKIVKELEKQGINIFNYYFYNGNIVNNIIEDDDIWRLMANSPCTRFFYNNLFSSGWSNSSSWFKIKYLLFHPKFAFSFLSHKLDIFTNYSNGRKRIEKLCVSNNIDYILGFSAPHEVESILCDIKTDIPISVFRLDPYAYNPCYPDSEFDNRISEECKLLSRINTLFTTNLIIRDLLNHNKTKAFSDKMCPVEFPLISEEDVMVNQKNEMSHLFDKCSENTYLLHAGTFYDDIRNPGKLVEFVKNLPESYYLVVAGTNSSDIRSYDSDIRNRVIDLGCLPRKEIDVLIENCDFLISYNNLNTNMVPSKLFECIDSGKPFVNLCQTNQCPTIDYVKDYDNAFTVILDKPIPKKELLDFFERTKGNITSREQILEKFGNCTVKYIANQIISSFDLSNR